MDITMQRLYAATQELFQVNTQTGVALLLNTSPQVVKNWEKRGISNQGILAIQEKLNVSSNWVKTGKGEMVIEKNNAITNINNTGNITHFVNENYGTFVAQNHEKPLELIDLNKSITMNLKKPFYIKVPNDELQSIGIFKDDLLLIKPGMEAQHNHILLVSSNGRGIVARLSIDLKNQYFLKYNNQQPEIMPPDTKIIGVAVELKRVL
jgi:hypothetical protein